MGLRGRNVETYGRALRGFSSRELSLVLNGFCPGFVRWLRLVVAADRDQDGPADHEDKDE